MNKEELMTLPTLQGTSHCSCLEHCFLFYKATQSAENTFADLVSKDIKMQNFILLP